MNTKVTDEMVEALRTVASQHLYAEMNDEAQMCADFEGGYDSLIAVARAALSSQDQEPIAWLSDTKVCGEPEFGLSEPCADSFPVYRHPVLSPPIQGVETVPPVDQMSVSRWLPIALADRTITNVEDFSEVGITICTSDRYWVRDEDGRVYEAAWSEGNKGDRDYWWDFEGESPVDPVEFMPHPLDPKYAATEASTDE